MPNSDNNKDTKRDRREEAKKARLEAQRKAKRAASMRKMYGAIAVVLAIALIVFLVQNSGKKGKQTLASVNTLAATAGCTEVKEIPELTSNPHLTTETAPHEPYNSVPATSGQHLGSVQKTGAHTNPVTDEAVIHNLEHGNIAIAFNKSLPEDVRTAVEDFATKNNTAVLSAPRDDLPEQLAITSWTRIITCAQPTSGLAVVELAEEFLKAFKGQSPEGFVPSSPI